ncbi:MAG TPA: cell division protein SepF [Dermatophilaceae bacterium]|nr:cell division protein SepF [Dermatophilaceae bacterium]
MAGAMRKAMVYLGLAEEDERYEGYDDEAGQDSHGPRRPGGGASVAVEEDEGRGAEVRNLPRRVPVSQAVHEVEVGALHRITTIHPRTYNEAKTIGENFRVGTPVIMNLTDLDDADAKRLVDFAAGLVFGLKGTIERVTSKVFLLSPAHVEVTSEEGEPAKGTKGLFNQS